MVWLCQDIPRNIGAPLMSFSAEWLALREPIDHAARDAGVLAAVINLIKGETPARITDCLLYTSDAADE